MQYKGDKVGYFYHVVSWFSVSLQSLTLQSEQEDSDRQVSQAHLERLLPHLSHVYFYG